MSNKKEYREMLKAFQSNKVNCDDISISGEMKTPMQIRGQRKENQKLLCMSNKKEYAIGVI